MATEFRVPNVKAPRFRQNAVNIIDTEFIAKFYEKHPKHKNLTASQIKKIIKSFNEALWEAVIDNRDGVRLPEALGSLFIGTCKATHGRNIDYAKSKKYGVVVSNKNWETDGRLAKIFYTSFSSKYKFSFRECWSFKACRNFKRAVAKNYPENWTMYIQVDSTKKLRGLYGTALNKEKKLREQNAQLKTYNEFDL